MKTTREERRQEARALAAAIKAKLRAAHALVVPIKRLPIVF